MNLSALSIAYINLKSRLVGINSVQVVPHGETVIGKEIREGYKWTRARAGLG